MSNGVSFASPAVKTVFLIVSNYLFAVCNKITVTITEIFGRFPILSTSIITGSHKYDVFISKKTLIQLSFLILLPKLSIESS